MFKKEKILNFLKTQQNYYSKNYGIKFIGLFGSFAKDEADEKSDIDILYTIEKGKKLSLFSYLKLKKELEDYFHKKVDLVREETIKPQLKSYIHKDLHYV